MTVKSFRDLIVWQKAMDFCEITYRVSNHFPRAEQFGLTAQLRRAAVSVPSNIAEGHGRQTTRDFLHFLSIASGSLNEAQTQILLAERLTFVNPQQIESVMSLAAEVGRMRHALCKSLEAKLP